MLLAVAANQELHDKLAAVDGQPLIYVAKAAEIGSQPSLVLTGPVPFMIPSIVLEVKSGCSPLGQIFSLTDVTLDNTIIVGDRDGLLFVCDQPPALCSPDTCP